MKEGVTIINIMADGSICEDLSTYLTPDRPLPETVERLIVGFIHAGHALRTGEGASP